MFATVKPMAIVKSPVSFCVSALLGAALFAPLKDLALRESPAVPALRSTAIVPELESGPRAPDLERLRERIADVLEETGTPGAAVALIQDGRTIWTAGIGKADVERDIPATADTPFRAGSITKTFVALSVMQLVEAGKLKLDQRVDELAPELGIANPWDKTHPLLLAHLLEHTAGFDDFHLCEYAHDDPNPIALKDALAYNPRSRRLRWPPGMHYSYSNSGPPVAAYIVEKITGEPFDAYLQRSVLARLEMPRASLLPVEGLATGYRTRALTPVPYWNLLMRPAGALNASANDLSHLVEMFANQGAYRGQTFLTPASIQRMRTPRTSQAAQVGLRFGYGVGLYSTLTLGGMLQGHDGGMDGYVGTFAFSATSRGGFAVLVNRGGEALAKIDKLLRNEIARMEAPARPRIALTAGQAARYAGTYRYASPRQGFLNCWTRMSKLKIAAEDERVYLVEGRDRVELIPVDEHLFRVPNISEPLLAFLPQPGGGMDLETGYLTFSRVKWWGPAFEKLVLDLFGWLWFPMLSTCVRLFFRGVFRNEGRGVIAWSMPLMPVLCAVSLFAWWLPFFRADDLIGRYGRVTVHSLLFFTMSLSFAGTTLWSLKHLRDEWDRRDVVEAYWPVTAAVGYQLVLVAYFLYHKQIGLMTWWY